MSKRTAASMLGSAHTVISPAGVSGLVDEMEVQMLGAGQEVGRSCCVVKYKGRTVVLDTGIHPAFSGMTCLPFLDELDWSTVSAILISHFHLDHVGALPYIMEKTNFRDGGGKVYMTHPTKAVYRYLMNDFVRVSMSGSDDKLFTEDELERSWREIISFDFEQELVLPATENSPAAVRVSSFAAGHVLGACMFLLDIDGTRVLYTGDYSTEEDRHLVPARVPTWDKGPDVMICESTYGVQSHEGRLEKEARFTNLVRSIVKRGGRVLLPVFALGRAQEILLLLDEYWAAHPELHHIPVYFVSSLAIRCMEVYKQYIHTMAPNVRERFARGQNPFDFRSKGSFIRPVERGLAKINDKLPCVVMASPGFLTSGVSRELLERWAPDPRNGLIVTGYSVEGVMARTIMNEPTEIIGLNGQRIARRMSVDYISFSAHVDYTQNAKFIDDVMPPHLILVHGEVNTMGRLRAALKSKFAERKDDIQIYTPRNVEVVKLKFRGERMARALGTIADEAPAEGSTLAGLLVSKDSTYTLLDPSDLREFTGLSTSVISQRQRVACTVGWDLVRWHVQGMYGKIEEGVDAEKTPTIRIMSSVDIKRVSDHELAVEWVSSVTDDMIADSVVTLVLGIDSSPASVKKTTPSHRHRHAEPETPPPEIEDAPVVKEEVDGDAAMGESDDKAQLELVARRAQSRLDSLLAFIDSYFGNVELVHAEFPLPQPDEPAVDEHVKPEPEASAKPNGTAAAASEPPADGEAQQAAVNGDAEQGEAEDEEAKPVPTVRLPAVRVRLDDSHADVRLDTLEVASEFEPLKRRVESVVELAMSIITPLSGRKRDRVEAHKPKRVIQEQDVAAAAA